MIWTSINLFIFVVLFLLGVWIYKHDSSENYDILLQILIFLVLTTAFCVSTFVQFLLWLMS